MKRDKTITYSAIHRYRLYGFLALKILNVNSFNDLKRAISACVRC